MQAEKQKLNEVVDIGLGYSFRGAIDKVEDGNTLIIQAKDIKDNFILTEKNNLVQSNTNINDDWVLKKDNILLSNRMYFKASVFKGADKKTITSSSSYILKLEDEKKVLAEYLAIWLNSSSGQSEINKKTSGSAVKTILRRDLESLEVDIPDLEKQKLIIKLFKNKLELKDKLKEKENIIENIFQGTLRKLIKK